MDGDGAGKSVVVRTIDAIAGIDPRQWDRLAAPEARTENPFVRHAFLAALEQSGSVGPGTGWTPLHVVAMRGDTLIAAAPAYLKDHSYGEYVFDHGWADAYARAGRRYYPKLLCAVPFTPVAGPRLFAEDADGRALLARALIAVTQKLGLSSVHVNFVVDDAALAAEGFLPRDGVQFHWFNRGYRTYEDFLGALSSRYRKALKRERREAAEGLTIRRLTGDEIREHHWDVFWRFYQDTGARKWGEPYLTRPFFSLLGETMREHIVLVLAEDAGRPIAGALNLIGGDALYGRYWGRTQDRPFLHFEVCYHQAIEHAIEQGLARVEAGAQGEHKLARGYEPVIMRSAHWIADPGFRAAVARFLTAERLHLGGEATSLAEALPFRAEATDPH